MKGYHWLLVANLINFSIRPLDLITSNSSVSLVAISP